MPDSAFSSFDIPKVMTRGNLEYWILFGICVAGKGAKQTDAKLTAMLKDIHGPTRDYKRPFEIIQKAIYDVDLMRKLRYHKMGQYKRIYKAFRAVVKLDLRDISIEMLEAVPGIGPKTARMTMLYYKPWLECVPLDTHVLKYLKAQGIEKVPKSTPPAGKTYARLETEFVKLAKAQGKTVAALDTEVWKSYAKA